MKAKREQAARLRALAAFDRESARVAASRQLTWAQAWEMHRACVRAMFAAHELPATFYQSVKFMLDRGGTTEEFVEMFKRSAREFEREADALEKETT